MTHPNFLSHALMAVIILGLSFLSAENVVAQTTVVVPSGQAASEGNSENGFPFNISCCGLSSQRYQQVYA